MNAFGQNHDDDLRAEIEVHIEQRIADLISDGLPREEARRRALREFGNPTLILERGRDVWRWTVVDDLVQDLRYGCRMLHRSPGFAFVAVLCLALGIGATTALFSLVYGILVRPLPYRSPEQLFVIWNSPVKNPKTQVFAQFRDFENFRDRARSFQEFAAVTWALDGRTMTGRGAPRKVLVIPATEGLFRLLGARPQIGRTFRAEDLSAGCTVVLAHRFWAGVLSSDQRVVGQTIRLEDQACTVVGVMPREFVFFPEPTEVWSLIRPGRSDQQILNGGVGVFARLRPDANLKTGADELKALVAGIDGGIRYGVRMQPVVRPLQEEFTWLAGRNLRASLIILFAAAVAVLLISCFNVANLLLGRSVEREREMALRAALGSGRGRLVRQLLTESLLLAILSAGIGMLIAFGAVHWFRLAQPIELPVGSVVAVNLPVLAFAAIVAASTAILFGFVPAWKASGVSLSSALQSGARTLPRFGKMSRMMIAAEVAFSLPLLIAAGLLIQSIQSFATTPLGFDADRLVRVPVSVPRSLNPAERIAFYRQLLIDAEAAIGSSLVSLSTAVPVRGGRGTSVLVLEGRPEPTPDKALIDVAQESVSEGYFKCLGIPVRNGREFNALDQRKTAAVAIVNRQLARKYFADQDPMGKRIKLLADSEWLTIVGIAEDEKRSTPFQEMAWVSPPIVYRPLAQRPADSANLLFRRDSPGQIQRTLQARHPGALIAEPELVAVLVDTYLKYPRFRAVLAAMFALLALVLAVVGVYGVLSHLVTRRSREIGIRMALGAQRRAVVSMIVKEGAGMTLLGSVAGLALTWWTGRFLTSLLYGVAPLDPVTVTAVVFVLIAVSLVAVSIPARRAASVDPVKALRQD